MDETTNIRLTAIETRLAAIEARLSALEQSTAAKPRRRKELSPEERQAIRARLVEGKRKKILAAEAEREAAAAAETAKISKKKEVKNGTSTTEN